MDKVNLVVNSKVKNYIKEKSDLKCSIPEIAEVLTKKIEAMCDAAIENTKKEKRKTVKGRDFE